MIISCLRVDPKDRPSSLELKKHPYFKGVDFDNIFKQVSPLNKDVLLKMCNQGSDLSTNSSTDKSVEFVISLEKRMFFGNYKPRVLKMYRRGEGLYMSYWYLDGKAPKN